MRGSIEKLCAMDVFDVVELIPVIAHIYHHDEIQVRTVFADFCGSGVDVRPAREMPILYGGGPNSGSGIRHQGG